MAYVIGVDGGTESLRAFVFDLAGRPVASHASPYETDFPAPGRAEQSPDAWWQAMGEAVRGAVSAAGVSGTDILGLAFDATCCTVVALDAHDRPLRPAILWMDVRSAEESQLVAATGDPALCVNGDGRDPVSAEWMIPKALWIRRNEPEIFSRANKICEYQEYINLRLTGRYVGSLLTASMRWHYRDGIGFPESLLATLDLADLQEKWPSEILPVGTPIGGLTSQAAEHLGLPAGLLVAQGGADAMIGMIGLGVSTTGEMALITGSSHLQLGLTEQDVHRQGVWGTYRNAVYPGLNLLEGGQTSTGSVIAWFKRNFAAETSYETLNAEAASIAPGADGVRALDHFQGNRTPFVDPLSRGALVGLSLSHSPAHVFRAIIESVCLGTRLIVDNFGDGFALNRIVVAGGATRSPLWLQIHADTLQVPLQLTEVADAPGLGCAILAAVASGAHASTDTAIAEMVRVTGEVDPNPSTAEAYDQLLHDYRALYHAMKDLRG